MIQAPHPRNVLIIHDTPMRAGLIEEGLPSEMVAHKIQQIQGLNLLELLDCLNPVIIVFTCNSPSLSTFESLHQVSQTNPKPILMFVEETDEDLMQKAIKVGVSAYVVDGLSSSRVQPLIETAMARFKLMTELETELRQTKDDLTARKTIERAKGLLMSQHAMTEEAAFASMRDMSQRQSKPLKDVAENIISVLSLLSKKCPK